MSKNDEPEPRRGEYGRLVRRLMLILALAAGCEERVTRNSDGSPPENEPVGPQPGMTVPPTPLVGICENTAKVLCHRLSVCGPVTLRSRYGEVAACEAAELRTCEGTFVEARTSLLVDWGLVAYDDMAMGAALSAFSRRHCESALGPPSPFVALRGLLEIGVECKHASTCQSGYCGPVAGSRCGECKAAPASNEECPERCEAGSQCRCTNDDAGERCRCEAALKIDEDCEGHPNRCDEGLFCVTSGSGASRRSRCRPVPAQDGTCGPEVGIARCIGEAWCDLGGATRGTCRAPTMVGSGEACDTAGRLCPAGFDCRGVCVRQAAEGEMCTNRAATTLPDGGPPTCSGGRCAGACQPLGTDGRFCTEPRDCVMALGCDMRGISNGRCRTWEQARTEAEQLFLCR